MGWKLLGNMTVSYSLEKTVNKLPAIATAFAIAFRVTPALPLVSGQRFSRKEDSSLRSPSLRSPTKRISALGSPSGRSGGEI